MQIVEIQNKTFDLIESLIKIWENSVRETHLFLSDEEIKNIKNYVPQALIQIPHLIVIKDEQNIPIAFMGISKNSLEMLFISPEKRGKGLGKTLVKYGIENYNLKTLTVNEQNPQAKGFYEKMGFKTYKRTPYDEQGNTYPILYMSL